MLARRQALQRMHSVGITPKRQVLDNKISMVYRQEIMATGIPYQLVQPGDHRQNIAGKKIQAWKDQFISVCSGVSANFQCTYGEVSSHKQRNSCYYSDNQMSIQNFQLSLTSTDRITITRNHSSPLVWKP